MADIQNGTINVAEATGKPTGYGSYALATDGNVAGITIQNITTRRGISVAGGSTATIREHTCLGVP